MFEKKKILDLCRRSRICGAEDILQDIIVFGFFWRGGGRLYSYIDCNEWREKEREVESQLIWDRTLKINYNWSSIEKNCFLNEVAVKLLWNHVNVKDHSSAFPLSSQPLG